MVPTLSAEVCLTPHIQRSRAQPEYTQPPDSRPIATGNTTVKNGSRKQIREDRLGSGPVSPRRHQESTAAKAQKARSGLAFGHGELSRSVGDVWAQARALLMSPPRSFDGFVKHTKRVSPTCLVHFERNRYSVPASYANRPGSLRVYAHRLVVATEGQLVCKHVRIIDRRHDTNGRTVSDWRHYLPVLQRKS